LKEIESLKDETPRDFVLVLYEFKN